MKHFLTLTRMRIRLTLRNKMFLFFSVIMPFGFFFLYAGIIAKGDPRIVRFLLGPVIAMAVMGSKVRAMKYTSKRVLILEPSCRSRLSRRHAPE